MGSFDIFKWLVEFHSRVNLERCLPYVSEGKVHVRGDPLQEGYDENDLCKGLLIVANGDTLMSRLREDLVIHDELGEVVKIKNKHDFFRYLLTQRNSDGAYLFDRVNGKISRVSELNNHLPNAARLSLSTMVPEDFVSSTGDVAVAHNMGTKTRLAIKFPHAYSNTETFQIKRSAYTPFGLGKVTHFGAQGLLEEMFFTCDPDLWEARPTQSIKLVYRRYGRDSAGQLVKMAEEVRSFAALKSLKKVPLLRVK